MHAHNGGLNEGCMQTLYLLTALHCKVIYCADFNVALCQVPLSLHKRGSAIGVIIKWCTAVHAMEVWIEQCIGLEMTDKGLRTIYDSGPQTKVRGFAPDYHLDWIVWHLKFASLVCWSAFD